MSPACPSCSKLHDEIDRLTESLDEVRALVTKQVWVEERQRVLRHLIRNEEGIMR